ncbi:MAG: adenosine deaminase [Pseudomonadota bacterium]
MKHSPKLELHLHLEGAAPPAFIRGLAQSQGVSLAGVFTEDGSYAFRDFNQFLQVYEEATSVLKTPEHFAQLVCAVLEESLAQGVIYTESFISPDFCGGRDLGAWREYLAAMQEAAAAFEDEIMMRGVITCIRHFGPDKAKETALCAAETVGDFVVGFGIAGDEMAGKPSDFAYSFDMAREAGLGLTAHAGEWGGAASVRDALDALRVTRIGHGVQAISDPALVERLVREEITLEVCPGSNVALGVVPNWRAHPIEKLRAAGVPITVSTDDPPFFHTTMIQEYEHLADTFGWEAEHFSALNDTAIEAAFCSEDDKLKLAKRLGDAHD